MDITSRSFTPSASVQTNSGIERYTGLVANTSDKHELTPLALNGQIPVVSFYDRAMAIVSLDRPEPEKITNRAAVRDFFDTVKSHFGDAVIDYIESPEEQKRLIDTGAPLSLGKVRDVLAKAQAVTLAITEYYLDQADPGLRRTLGVAQYARNRADEAQEEKIAKGNPMEHLQKAAGHSVKVVGGVAAAATSAVVSGGAVFTDAAMLSTLLNNIPEAAFSVVSSATVGLIAGLSSYFRNQPTGDISTPEGQQQYAASQPGVTAGAVATGVAAGAGAGVTAELAAIFVRSVRDDMNYQSGGYINIGPIASVATGAMTVTAGVATAGASLLASYLMRTGVNSVTQGIRDTNKAITDYYASHAAGVEALKTQVAAQAAQDRVPRGVIAPMTINLSAQPIPERDSSSES